MIIEILMARPEGQEQGHLVGGHCWYYRVQGELSEWGAAMAPDWLLDDFWGDKGNPLYVLGLIAESLIEEGL